MRSCALKQQSSEAAELQLVTCAAPLAAVEGTGGVGGRSLPSVPLASPLLRGAKADCERWWPLGVSLTGRAPLKDALRSAGAYWCQLDLEIV